MTRIGTFAAIVLLVIVGLLGASAAFSGATHTYSATETFSMGTSQTTFETSPSQTPVTSFYDNETATNSSGTTLTEGTDYDWNTTDGNLTVYSTASTDNEDITLDYWYEGHTNRSASIQQVLSLVFEIGAILMLLGGALVVIQWTTWIGGGR